MEEKKEEWYGMFQKQTSFAQAKMYGNLNKTLQNLNISETIHIKIYQRAFCYINLLHIVVRKQKSKAR